MNDLAGNKLRRSFRAAGREEDRRRTFMAVDRHEQLMRGGIAENSRTNAMRSRWFGSMLDALEDKAARGSHSARPRAWSSCAASASGARAQEGEQFLPTPKSSARCEDPGERWPRGMPLARSAGNAHACSGFPARWATGPDAGADKALNILELLRAPNEVVLPLSAAASRAITVEAPRKSHTFRPARSARSGRAQADEISRAARGDRALAVDLVG